MFLQSAIMVPHPPLIIPQVGRGQEKAIQDTIHAYRKAAELIASGRPDTVIVITPHSVLYGDYFHISPGTSAKGSLAQFHAGDVQLEVAYDAPYVAELCRRADACELQAGTSGERDKKLDHAAMVPLCFLRDAFGGAIPCKIVRIGLSGLSYPDHYKLGMLIRETADSMGRSIAVIASATCPTGSRRTAPMVLHRKGRPMTKRSWMSWPGQPLANCSALIPTFAKAPANAATARL
jgi:aromatic ring-opening dioxygenase LigB subunit